MKSALVSRDFWARTGERAVRTFAQFLLVATGVNAFNIVTFGWIPAIEMAAGGALASVLMSVVAGKVTGSPSLLGPAVVIESPAPEVAPSAPLAADPGPLPDDRGRHERPGA